MTEEELSREIEEAIKSIEAKSQKDMGKVIKTIMDKFPGRTDGKVLSGMVLKRLSSK